MFPLACVVVATSASPTAIFDVINVSTSSSAAGENLVSMIVRAFRMEITRRLTATGQSFYSSSTIIIDECRIDGRGNWSPMFDLLYEQLLYNPPRRTNSSNRSIISSKKGDRCSQTPNMFKIKT